MATEDAPLGSPIDVGELPVISDDDVKRIYPAELRGGAGPQPIQETFVAGQKALHSSFHDRAAFAAQQSDPLRATAQYLDSHAGDRGFQRAVGEKQEDFRSRLLADPELVSRITIVDAINAILARYTTAECQISEAILDRWFVRDEVVREGGGEIPVDYLEENDVGFRSFINANPDYPDRLYPDSGQLPFRRNSMPGGARAFADATGRRLIIRIPDLASLDGLRGYARSDTVIGAPRRLFIRSATGGTNQGSFLAKRSGTARAVYGAIANVVRGIKGQSVRWTLFIDKRLNEIGT